VDLALCEKSLQTAVSIPSQLVGAIKNCAEILNFSRLTGLSAYDSVYAILTKQVGGILITLDSKLATTCEQHQISVFQTRLN
jgi:predicted nucleic acid-binding protein